MADIRSMIMSKFEIDIAQENILKLYKIDNENISPQELAEKIQQARKRWNSSINGANEKNAQRDQARLEKADKYEAILRDGMLRKALFEFYNKPAETGANGSTAGGGPTEFAREYFELVATTKNIKKADVDFFFKYYQSERKNKKAILEMLSKDLKIRGLGKEEKYADEEAEEKEGKKKNASSPLIVNLFQETTILKIRRAIEKYEEVAQNKEICHRYPQLKNGLYEFLEISSVNDAKQFTEKMSIMGKEVYAVRQEKGTDYVPLVDLFNILQSVGEYRDVVDNIQEFKLLLKYPNLTPYMFAFVEMKPVTLERITDVAKKEYSFRDGTDFILNYYKPLYDNFGIGNGGIAAILKSAEKKARQNKVLNEIDEKLGRNKKKRTIPIGAEIVHWLVYWPIFAVYFVFEVAKVVFTKLHFLTIPLSLLLFVAESWYLPKKGIDNLWILRKLFFKNQWLSYLDGLTGDSGANVFLTVVLSLVVIIILLTIYVLPPVLLGKFINEFSYEYNKRFDWVGYERTFKQILDVLKKKTEDEYSEKKDFFVKSLIPKAIINLVCLIVLIVIIVFTSIGYGKLRESIRHEREEVAEEIAESEEAEFVSGEEELSEENIEEDVEENEIPVGNTMVITVESANIRTGPGVDYGVVTVASMGDTFVASGNQEEASNGRIWYEIYLDEEMTQIGWASQSVIEFQ